MDDMEQIGFNTNAYEILFSVVTKLYKESGLAPDELAAKANITAPRAFGIINGKAQSIRIKEIEMLAKAFDVDAEVLFSRFD